jgi:hypothetical protein
MIPPDRPGRPTYLVVQGALLAGAILLAPLLMASWFALCPQYGNPACPDNSNHLAALVAYRAASPTLLEAFLLVNVPVPYLFSLSYVALGIVAMKGSPWLATLGIICGWLGSAPWGLVTSQSFLLADMARLNNDPLFVDLIDRIATHPEIYAMAGGWVLGHLFGYLFLGLAFIRGQAVPRWAAYLMVIAVPLMGPLAYGTGQGYLQVLGFLLIFVATVPAAIAMLRGPPSGP